MINIFAIFDTNKYKISYFDTILNNFLSIKLTCGKKDEETRKSK